MWIHYSLLGQMPVIWLIPLAFLISKNQEELSCKLKNHGILQWKYFQARQTSIINAKDQLLPFFSSSGIANLLTFSQPSFCIIVWVSPIPSITTSLIFTRSHETQICRKQKIHIHLYLPTVFSFTIHNAMPWPILMIMPCIIFCNLNGLK